MRLFLAIIGITLLASCANPLYKPFKRVTTTVFPEYKVYVLNDDTFTIKQKKRRIKGLENVDKLLRDYEEVEGD